MEKGEARIDIKRVDCPTETCLETKINNDLNEIKRKKMKVVGNSYTGEEIKRIEFSTGEPFFYVSFYTPKTDFGAGYFLINNQAYSILARNLTYAETDLIFSFISPTGNKHAPEEELSVPAQPLEMDLQDPRAYNINSMPDVIEAKAPAPKVAAAKQETKPKKSTSAWRVNTFVSKRMPPYIRWDAALHLDLKGRRANHELGLGLYNLLNRHNPFMLRYNPDTHAWNLVSLIPIMPSLSWRMIF